MPTIHHYRTKTRFSQYNRRHQTARPCPNDHRPLTYIFPCCATKFILTFLRDTYPRSLGTTQNIPLRINLNISRIYQPNPTAPRINRPPDYTKISQLLICYIKSAQNLSPNRIVGVIHTQPYFRNSKHQKTLKKLYFNRF
jgi:hypothetical protein